MSRMLDVADSRGISKHGWLYSRHIFSFSGYYNPERMGFGLLRFTRAYWQVMIEVST